MAHGVSMSAISALMKVINRDAPRLVTLHVTLSARVWPNDDVCALLRAQMTLPALHSLTIDWCGGAHSTLSAAEVQTLREAVEQCRAVNSSLSRLEIRVRRLPSREQRSFVIVDGWS